MHCLGYLGHVLHTCFYCGQHRGGGVATTPHSHDSAIVIPSVRPPQLDSLHSDTLLPVESASRCPTAYASARNRAVRFVPPAAWDVKPRSCRSGHWTMRYTRPTRNNLNPWSPGMAGSDGTGAGPFDLVPWRQRRGRVNLAHATGWDNVSGLPFRRPVKRSATAAAGSRPEGGRGRRLVRIRVVLSFQFQKRLRGGGGGVQQRRSRMRNRGSRVRPNGQQQQQLHDQQPGGQRQVFVFDPKLFRLSADWLGYFSQRPAGVEELLAGMSRQVEAARGRQIAGNSTPSSGGGESETTAAAGPLLRGIGGIGAADRMDYRTLFGKVSRLFFGGGGSGSGDGGNSGSADRQVFKQVPCLQCRQRYNGCIGFSFTVATKRTTTPTTTTTTANYTVLDHCCGAIDVAVGHASH